MSVVSDDIEPLAFVFADDGLVPNNPMPFLVYKGAIDVADFGSDPESLTRAAQRGLDEAAGPPGAAYGADRARFGCACTAAPPGRTAQ